MYFIWEGKIFKVPLSTLQRPKCKGGMDLINPMAKCRAMRLYRLLEHIRQQESTTMELLRQCKLEIPSINPPQRHIALNKQTYLQQVYCDSAYITPRIPQEFASAFRRRLYKTIYTTINDTTLTIPMRVNRHGQQGDWKKIWENLWMAPVPEKTKCHWYEVIHDLIPTSYRLHAINLSSSDFCTQCMQPDTIQHRLTQCGQAPAQWKWTQERLAIILRTSTNHILQEWLQRPSFYFWPLKRQHAVL